MKVKTVWISHLKSKEEKEEFLYKLTAAQVALQRLKQIIEKKIEANTKSRVSEEGYKDASWAYRQADLVGEERAFRELLDIIDLKGTTND